MPRLRRLNSLPLADRPREKLLKKGVHALSDFELLEVIIGNGTTGADVSYIARQVQKLMQKGILDLTHDSLSSVRGISTATSSKILASIELAHRHLVQDTAPLTSIPDILSHLSDITAKQQEHFVCMSLDGGRRLIAQRTIAIGTLDTILTHPREVFADAITDRAACIVIAHNHPSGDPSPSQQDITLTQQLAAAGQLLGISLYDHLIVTRKDHYSFRQHHLL